MKLGSKDLGQQWGGKRDGIVVCVWAGGGRGGKKGEESGEIVGQGEEGRG